MGLDTRYIPIKYLQELFRDKDTGLPLSAGKVYFYKDQARTILKPVYQLTGSPPNYTYAALPNPLTLSAAGTFQDGSGNDIAVYYFPYDSSGNLELYYVKVESAGAVLQFTREGQPNLKAKEDDTVDVKNNVPNGQFLTHNDIKETPSRDAGEITQAITDIAPGGWTFERPGTSTAKDYITFERFASPVDIPSSHPRYAARVKTTVADADDTYKGLRLKYRDVNKFASDTEEYTFSFSGKSNISSDLTIPINLIKNYGSGGSATNTTLLQSITLTPTYQVFNITFIFGKNTSKTIGANNDDFLQLELGLPTSYSYDISVTNFALPKGDIDISLYPIATSAQSLYRSLAGWLPIPDYEGANLYLPVILGPKGLEYDDSQIGKIFSTSLELPAKGELLLNGANYDVAEYSSEGIPYRRLYEKWKDIYGLSKFGASTYFANIIDPGLNPNDFRIYNRLNGNVTDTADGTPATGFTFVKDQDGSPTQPEITTISTVAGSSIPAGANFTFHVPAGPDTDWYVWYKVNGSGTDPAISGYRGILVEILSTDTNETVRNKTMLAINATNFHVPHWNGYFFRFWDNGHGIDPDASSRTARGDGITGDAIGTYQQDEFKFHGHNITVNLSSYSAPVGGTSALWDGFDAGSTSGSGGNETRPKNVYLNYVVKY